MDLGQVDVRVFIMHQLSQKKKIKKMYIYHEYTSFFGCWTDPDLQQKHPIFFFFRFLVFGFRCPRTNVEPNTHLIADVYKLRGCQGDVGVHKRLFEFPRLTTNPGNRSWSKTDDGNTFRYVFFGHPMTTSIRRTCRHEND